MSGAHRKYVFCVGLVPVQAWISSARRSRDLHAGSVMLSWWMGRLLGKLAKEPELGLNLVVPRAPDDLQGLGERPFAEALGDDYSLPNRASGFLDTSNETLVQGAFETLDLVVNSSWAHLQQICFEDLRLKEPALHRKIEPLLVDYLAVGEPGWDCPVDLLWVALPVAPGEAENRSLERVDAAFRSVKISRPVRPWPLESPVGKCNQCARREAIGPQESFPEWRRWNEELSQVKTVEKGRRLDAGERLCFVCFTRRLAGYLRPASERFQSFPSTSKVAAWPWVRCVRQASSSLLSCLKDIETSPAGREDFGRALGRSFSTLQTEGDLELLALRKNLLRQIDLWNRERSPETTVLPSEPSPYLALLSFDGDSMGAHVRAQPNKMTECMKTFGAKVSPILKGDLGGAVFYLGGDEGLAMVPAGAALRAALAVRKAFSEAFGDSPDAPTLSAGIAFFEQKSPLAGAIQAAHGALSSAKRTDGKNSLVVSVDRGSGGGWDCVPRSWGKEWQRLETAVALVQKGELASGWAYDAAAVVAGIPAEGWAEEPVRSAVLEEVRRLFHRRLKLAKGSKEDRWRSLAGDGWWAGNWGEAPRPEWFHLLSFLARLESDSPLSKPGDKVA